MPKKRDRSELEHLRGENRKLKSELSKLRRRLKQESKGHRVDDELREEYLELIAGQANEPLPPVCPECSSRDIKVLDVGSRTIRVCGHCSYRQSVPNKP